MGYGRQAIGRQGKSRIKGSEPKEKVGRGGEENGAIQKLQSKISRWDTGNNPNGTEQQRRRKGNLLCREMKEEETERSGKSNKNNRIEAERVPLAGIRRIEERNGGNKRIEVRRYSQPRREY